MNATFKRLMICANCDRSSKGGGLVYCEAEPTRVPIDDRAASAFCPHDFFELGLPAAPLSPGQLVATVLTKLGYSKSPGCGCASFARQLNQWGWWGCYRHRAEVVSWFVAKAREQKIVIDGDDVWALIRGGLRDMRNRRRGAN